MKFLVFLLLSAPLFASASTSSDYVCKPGAGDAFFLTIGTNYLNFNGVTGAYAASAPCAENGLCTFTSSYDNQATYSVHRSDYDDSQKYHRYISAYAAIRSGAEYFPYSYLPNQIAFIQEKAGQPAASTTCTKSH